MTETGTLHLSTPLVAVRSIAVSEMNNNVYLLTHKQSGAQILIDAADDFPTLKKFAEAALAADSPTQIGKPGAGIIALITTHAHWDHIRALPHAVAEWSPATYCGAADAKAIAEQEGTHIEHLLEGGERLHLAGLELDVIGLRGHTPGSVALAYQDPSGEHPTLLFTGDSLFPGGVGKTWAPEDFVRLFTDVSDRLFSRYNDAAVVLPGHGAPTTLGAERPHLPEWEERGW